MTWSLLVGEPRDVAFGNKGEINEGASPQYLPFVKRCDQRCFSLKKSSFPSKIREMYPSEGRFSLIAGPPFFLANHRMGKKLQIAGWQNAVGRYYFPCRVDLIRAGKRRALVPHEGAGK